MKFFSLHHLSSLLTPQLLKACAPHLAGSGHTERGPQPGGEDVGFVSVVYFSVMPTEEPPPGQIEQTVPH